MRTGVSLPDKNFHGCYEEVLATLKKMGPSLKEIEAQRDYGLLATDFHEGRFGQGRISTLRRAIQHVKLTGEDSFYVEIDFRNRGGLNAALGNTAANEVYGSIAGIIHNGLTPVASRAIFFRQRG